MTDEVSDIDLGIDVANAELDDDDLTRVLEALLLVVDTPVTAQTLATVTEQPVYRITAKLEEPVLAGFGPAPAAAWAQLRAGRPLDEWVESIPYRETRAYVKGVLSAREAYRRLAGRPPALDPDRPIPAPRDGVVF